MCYSHSMLLSVRPVFYLFLLLLIVSGDIHPNPGPNGSMETDISFCHVNARSILKPGRLEELYLELCCLHQFDIIGISESHLNNEIPDSDINIPNYSAYRYDRNRFGGGVMLYIHDRFSCKRRPDLESNNVEMLWVEIKCHSSVAIVGVCYRPPNQSANEVDSFLETLEESLSAIRIQNNQLIVLLGDFNDRCQSWDSDHAGSEQGLRLVNLVQSVNMFQLVKSPTRNNNFNTRLNHNRLSRQISKC